MDFETWKQFYNWGFCTAEQLKEALEQSLITQDEYNSILGLEPNEKEQEPKKNEIEPQHPIIH